MARTNATLFHYNPRFSNWLEVPFQHRRISSTREATRFDPSIVATHSLNECPWQRLCCPTPPCNIKETCQPHQPYKFQSLQHLKTNFIHTWHSVTGELLNYIGNFCHSNDLTTPLPSDSDSANPQR
ncbi:hypothetical protein AMECASPLE_027671 [Ameca splendens]|uniref:Uncharacterized protein n=1 Tax=Ameca splendens TaxID=208324 RepID=A0ABV0ZQ57_9TELE